MFLSRVIKVEKQRSRKNMGIVRKKLMVCYIYWFFYVFIFVYFYHFYVFIYFWLRYPCNELTNIPGKIPQFILKA